MIDFEVITAKANKNDIERIKLIIERLKEKNPSLSSTPLRFGKIGDDIIVTFKVDNKSYKSVIEKLVVNNIKVLSNSESTQRLIDTVKNSNVSNTAKSSGMGWDDLREKNQAGEHKKLQEFISEGNYNEVIRISRTVSLGREIVETAKNNIDHTIEKAINSAFNDGLTKKYDIDINIQKLVQIASDNNLKFLHKNDLMKQAGLNAVIIATRNKEYVGELIKMCNNNLLNNLVNIKAAVKFAEIVLPNPESFKEDILIAIRTINTRWLKIAFNVAANELSENEVVLFNKLIDFIDNHR